MKYKMKTYTILKTIIISLAFFIPCLGVAQDLQVRYINNTYDANTAPVKTALEFQFLPLNGVTQLQLLDIKAVDYTSLDLSGYSRAYGGWHKIIDVDGVRTQNQIWLADETTIYSFWQPLTGDDYKNAFFKADVLSRFDLGTVKQRSSRLFDLNLFRVTPVNFSSMLSRWVIVGISIFLVIPFWWLFRKFVR